MEEKRPLNGPPLNPLPEKSGGRARTRPPADLLFATVTGLSSGLVAVIALGILIVLVWESRESLRAFGWIGFVLETEWNPVTSIFGAATSLFGTVVTTILALAMAVPVAIGIAIFLAEVSPNAFKGPLGAAVELLAAIPSIVYGMWGLFTLAPIMAQTVEPSLQNTVGQIPGLGFLFEGTPLGVDLLTASVILSIMIIPFTASIARDAFNLTPALVKESAYGLGATKWEVVKDVVIPYSKTGVFGGIVLSLGRAIGETMAVAFVLGNTHRMPTSLLHSATSITVTLANEFTEADSDLYLSALYHLALLLFVFSFIILAVAKVLLARASAKNRPT